MGTVLIMVCRKRFWRGVGRFFPVPMLLLLKGIKGIAAVLVRNYLVFRSLFTDNFV